MKCFVVLSTILLLSSGISSLASGKNENRQTHTDRANDGCEWECTLENGSPVPQDFFQNNNSFIIKIEGDAEMVIYYNSNTGTLVILNKAIDIVIVFYGNSRVFAAINVQSGAGLLFNISTKYALYVELGSSVTSNYNDVVQLGLVIGNYIKANLNLMTSFTLGFNSNAFYFGSGLNWSISLAFRANLKNKINAALGALLSVVASRYNSLSGMLQAFNYGTLIVILGVAGTSQNFQSAFLSVTAYFAKSSAGFLSVNGALIFRSYLAVSAYLSALVAGTIKEIVITTGGIIKLVSASGAVAAEILVTGAIRVGGAICGTIGGLLAASASFLTHISYSSSFSFGFSVSFG